MGFAEASSMTKIGLGLSIAGLLFDLIGFTTPYWATYSFLQFSAHYGLFQTCNGDDCASFTATADWQTASQALSIIGFLFGVACVAVTVVFIFFKSDMEILKKVGFGTAFAAAGFIIVGAAVFAGKSSDLLFSSDLSWSFALTIIGGVLYIATGVVMVMQ